MHKNVCGCVKRSSFTGGKGKRMSTICEWVQLPARSNSVNTASRPNKRSQSKYTSGVFVGWRWLSTAQISIRSVSLWAQQLVYSGFFSDQASPNAGKAPEQRPLHTHFYWEPSETEKWILLQREREPTQPAQHTSWMMGILWWCVWHLFSFILWTSVSRVLKHSVSYKEGDRTHAESHPWLVASLERTLDHCASHATWLSLCPYFLQRKIHGWLVTIKNNTDSLDRRHMLPEGTFKTNNRRNGRGICVCSRKETYRISFHHVLFLFWVSWFPFFQQKGGS